MICPHCKGPMPECEAVAYRGRCENCATVYLPPTVFKTTDPNQFLRTDRRHKAAVINTKDGDSQGDEHDPSD